MTDKKVHEKNGPLTDWILTKLISTTICKPLSVVSKEVNEYVYFAPLSEKAILLLLLLLIRFQTLDAYLVLISTLTLAVFLYFYDTIYVFWIIIGILYIL